MKVDNPNAFRFLMQDEIYLLKEDKIIAPLPESPAGNLPQQPLLPVTTTEQKPAVVTPPSVAEPVVATSATPKLSVPPVIPSIPKAPEPVTQTPEPAFNYLGNNNKNFAILVNYAADEHIPAAHLTALESMLKRKELSLSDVAIFNLNRHQPISIAKVAELLKPIKMLIMGKDALPQGIGNLPFNNPVQGKKTHVLYSFSFDEMMSSNENKKAFWDQMKTL